MLLAGETMGTTWAVTLFAPDLSSEARADARAVVQARLDAVDGAMSTWDERSELARFNAHRSGDPFPLSPDTLSVIEMARGVAEASGGAFDPTVRPLVAAWGFGAGARVPGQGPDEADLAALRERVGMSQLALEAGAVRKRNPELELDLSAIAKGFGVDEVARALTDQGYVDFLVEVGGEVRARGTRPDGRAWRLAVERPEPDGRAVHAVIELSDRAMATSGDYRSFYEADGERLTHIVDPRTGRPVHHRLASVSVVHAEAALADAWATALMVLGPEEGFALAGELALAAYFIVRRDDGDYEVLATPAFPEIQAPER